MSLVFCILIDLEVAHLTSSRHRHTALRPRLPAGMVIKCARTRAAHECRCKCGMDARSNQVSDSVACSLSDLHGRHVILLGTEMKEVCVSACVCECVGMPVREHVRAHSCECCCSLPTVQCRKTYRHVSSNG